MKTQTKKKTTKPASKPTKQAASKKQIEKSTLIAIDKIKFSPFNYRKYYNPKTLNELAEGVKLRGIISPVTVRPIADGIFELVAGERRIRSAKIAGMKAIPAVVKELTDEEVREFQLDENMNRENPNPLHEAQAINDMLDSGKTIEEVALRLGKSKAFIYNRMKLATLIEPLQVIFIAEKMNIQQAFEIAKFPADAQQEFFETYCDDWEEDDFELSDVSNILYHFRYDLKFAPFNTKDEKLLPDVGACNGCPFNSATLKSLFPEMEQEAVCSNKQCYTNKCRTHVKNLISKLTARNVPDALITDFGHVSDENQETLSEMPELADLPTFSSYEIRRVASPEKPTKQDYTFVVDAETEKLDQNGFNAAMDEYKEDLTDFKERIKSGKLKRGLILGDNSAKMIIFSTEVQTNEYGTSQQKVTAKEVQEALKQGNATPELLQAEIDRINAREERAKEIDREKVQAKLHQQFNEFCENTGNTKALTNADIAASRLLVYQSLPYSVQEKANNLLFSSEAREDNDNSLFEILGGISEAQYSLLIRLVIAGKSDSKYPNNILGYSLYKMAEEAGLNVTAIEEEQADKAEERARKIALRIADLEAKIKKLNKSLELAEPH